MHVKINIIPNTYYSCVVVHIIRHVVLCNTVFLFRSNNVILCIAQVVMDNISIITHY